MPGLRVRQDVRVLQDEYKSGNKKPLSDLLRAWQGIQELPYDDYFSFFTIAGYHGEPFRGAGWGNPQWWGGYCNHGNVLFPTWHRAYLYRLENALRRIKGCENVTLPYWNELATVPAEEAIPWVFLEEEIELDNGDRIINPLRSYKFQHDVKDNLAYPIIGDVGDNADTPPLSDAQILNPLYAKAKNTPTCRFPFDGFNTPAAQKYNAQLRQKTPEELDMDLKQTVWDWINSDSQGVPVRTKFEQCLQAPNYTVFSNTTSRSQWNEDHPDHHEMALEQPHGDIHLAVGGFNFGALADVNVAEFALANGDMGENNTASFDPIFYFHHCFIDKLFWDWQSTHTNDDEAKTPCTDRLEVIEGYPGTNSVDNQGPTPGVAGGTWLSMSSELQPFHHSDTLSEPVMISKDVFNIKSQLGYDYAEPRAHPSLDTPSVVRPEVHAHVSGVNRGAIAGSFVIAAYKKDVKTGEKTLVGTEAVLSRWATSGCANCQTHLQVKAHIPLVGVSHEDISGQSRKFEIVAEVLARPAIKTNRSISKPLVTTVKVKSAKGQVEG